MRYALALLPLTLLAATCSGDAHFLERKATVGKQTYGYRVWLPRRYTKLHHWPVVLFLHGSGERGNDNLSQLTIGLGPALEKYASAYHCVVVLPQCPEGKEWYGEQETQALTALEDTIREFHGDRRRLYLTGVSMGGAGTWYMARHRRLWAAVVPVCGEVVRQKDDPFPSDPPPDITRIVGAQNAYAALAEAIGPTPTWAFHGAKDEVIRVTESRNMVAALRAKGGNVHYTEYSDLGHNVWDNVYSDGQFVRWMLSQRRPR